MKPILNRSNPLELNTLFIQPSRWCARNCTNCYVKEHSGGEDGRYLSTSVLAQLFLQFYKGINGAWANQITISIDDLPKHPTKYWWMRDIFIKIMDLIPRERIQNAYPEVHGTFHTTDTFKEYFSEWNPGNNYVSTRLDMISFSMLKESDKDLLDEIRQQTKVNYNYLIPCKITAFNTKKHIDHLTTIGRMVDHIYLVIMKDPIGKGYSELAQIGQRSRMRDDIEYINTLLEYLPEDVRQKISIDGCLQDTIKYTRTGFGCSANISRIQVWPDGSVTGCPYAFHSTGKPGSSVEDILENIKEARNKYDFRESCHLPNVYNSIRRRFKNSGNEIQTRKTLAI